MSARIFAGNRRVDAVPTDDRGLAYGDGLFETMRVHHGAVPWWEAHWARLADAGNRLQMALPDPRQALEEAAALFADGGDGVLKLLLTRGSGGRGYVPPDDPIPTWIVSRHELPPQSTRGLAAIWCDTRLATQPLLAGLKHCNRLEQVLARAECVAAGADEGLMCDHQGNVVGATSANLFVLCDGHWLTPLLDRCGVAGICRGQLIPRLDAREARLDRAAVEAADAVFLCNAVRGILPLAALDGYRRALHPALDPVRRVLAQLHPGFAIDMEHS